MRTATAYSRYTYGVSDPVTRAAKAEYQRDLRRERAGRDLETVREKLLSLITSGTPLPDAVKEIGHTAHKVHRWAAFFPDFADQLESAQLTGAPPGTRHGTAKGYRKYRCRCHACREWNSRNYR